MGLTHMRRGEVLGLQWQDVRCTATGTPEWIVLRPETTKTDRMRTIPVSDRMAAVLQRRRTDAKGAEHAPDAYVFGNAVGEHLDSVKTAWRATCRRAGIDDLHFHDLRREAACRWFEAGVPVHHIRDLLGPRRYQHDQPLPGGDADGVAAVDADDAKSASESSGRGARHPRSRSANRNNAAPSFVTATRDMAKDAGVIATIFPALVIGLSGLSKLITSGEWDRLFPQLGLLPAWFAVVVGATELVGVVMALCAAIGRLRRCCADHDHDRCGDNAVSPPWQPLLPRPPGCARLQGATRLRGS